jgi:hypothetical protein
MGKAQDTIGDTATGAGIGATIGGPVGAGIGAGAGALYGIFGDNRSDAANAHAAEFGKAADAYEAYRPVAIQARMNALKNAFSLFSPVQGALGNMYGGAAPQFDMSKAFQSPFAGTAGPGGQPPPAAAPGQPNIGRRA